MEKLKVGDSFRVFRIDKPIYHYKGEVGSFSAEAPGTFHGNSFGVDLYNRNTTIKPTWHYLIQDGCMSCVGRLIIKSLK